MLLYVMFLCSRSELISKISSFALRLAFHQNSRINWSFLLSWTLFLPVLQFESVELSEIDDHMCLGNFNQTFSWTEKKFNELLEGCSNYTQNVDKCPPTSKTNKKKKKKKRLKCNQVYQDQCEKTYKHPSWKFFKFSQVSLKWFSSTALSFS